MLLVQWSLRVISSLFFFGKSGVFSEDRNVRVNFCSINCMQVIEKNGSQDSNMSKLDLGLGLKSPDDNLDAVSDTEETLKKASPSGLWSMGEV